jgi:uncharacterized protein (TIGR02265 family)
MINERVEFEQSADGLFRGALQAHQDAHLVEKLRAAGLDLNRKLAPAYPAEDFYRWVRIAACHLFPGMDEEKACREVGRLAVIRGLKSTMLGRAALTAMQLLGVRRSLKRIGSTFKSGNNYVEARVTELSPTSMEIQLGPLVGPAAYFEGVLDEGPRQMGALDVRVTRARTEGEHIVWRVEWAE